MPSTVHWSLNFKLRRSLNFERFKSTLYIFKVVARLENQGKQVKCVFHYFRCKAHFYSTFFFRENELIGKPLYNVFQGTERSKRYREVHVMRR